MVTIVYVVVDSKQWEKERERKVENGRLEDVKGGRVGRMKWRMLMGQLTTSSSWSTGT